MHTAPLTLFDLDSKDGTPFSPKVWAIRLLLNYKQISYSTTWVGFADIGTVLPAAGVPPTRRSAPLYTVPAILDGERAISDSRAIAEYLERTYPARPVRLQAHKGVVETHILWPLVPLVVPNVVNILNERDTDYFVKSRRQIFRKELHEICPLSEREAAVQTLVDALTALAGLTADKNPEGWVFGAVEPVYEDFELVGLFMWLKVGGLPGLWERIKDLNNGRWGALLAAAQPYMEID
ncbi:hypothetical protein B0H16DRAFT_1535682 [Mycena metata]|uniref:GST N-terminal domain-containing protein n=1 Tax=Mycena metata TaxID=1033252 RepID=A0AAD7J6M3_9AGAR|nr:hypothetical protein B0H16DRAFT_1535682 [Mycena metata]